MNTRSLTILGGAAVLVTILAIVALRKSESSVEATPGGAKLFPDLTARVNDAASIEVKRSDGVTTLKKTEETWGLAEKSDFPVDMKAVRKCLIGLSQMTTAEEKTADPALYSKLGVGGRRELAAVLAEVSESVPRRAPAERPASSSPQ